MTLCEKPRSGILRLIGRILRLTDRMLGISCVALPFILTGILVSWYLEVPGIAFINMDRHYEISSGVPFRMEAPLATNALGSSLYELRIYNAEGRIVYEYEDLEASDFMTSVIVPGVLSPGVYQIGGSLQYKMNPIKTATVFVNFGTLNVLEATE